MIELLYLRREWKRRWIAVERIRRGKKKVKSMARPQ